jgi:hypothetical protein
LSPFDDCTNECITAIEEVTGTIRDTAFLGNLSNVIDAIFENAPNTKLFMTGYPHFFNDQTDQCNTVTFKAWCSNPSKDSLVLPLTKDRRNAINGLTTLVNQQIQSAASKSPFNSKIEFVDISPFFEGHRFCEEGINEPSLNNPDIWFFPLHFWTGSTTGTNLFDPSFVKSGDCEALYEQSADWGVYIACETANAVLAGSSINLNSQINNVPRNDSVQVSGSGGTPDYFARTFHPTTDGHGAIKDAVISAYNAAIAGPGSSTPSTTGNGTTIAYATGTCSFHLVESQTCDDNSKNLYATIKLLDNNKKVIGTTANINDGKGPSINNVDPFSFDSALPYTIVVTGEHRGDYLQFAYGGVSWKSTTSKGEAGCSQGGWNPRSNQCELATGPVQTRAMDCSFPC